MSTRLNIAGRLGQAAMRSYVTPIAGLLILLAGSLALFITPREENPQIDVPAANVLVQLPGASPQETLNLVVKPVERILREMQGVEHTYGTASDSLGVITVQFEIGSNKEQSLVRLYDRLMHNLDHIPPGASQPLVKPIDVDDVPIVTLTFSSPGHSDTELKQVAERVREQLTPLPGVAVADIIGGRDRSIQVNLDPDRLAGRGISLTEIYQTLNAANLDLPVGYTVNDQQVKTIRLQGALSSLEDVGNIVVAVRNQRPVYLRDIATITDGPGDIEFTHRIAYGPARGHALPGEPEHTAVTLALAKKRGANAVIVSTRILDQVEQLKKVLIPDDITVTTTRNAGDNADAAVNMLIEHLGIAVISVIIILLLFLGWREAAIVTINIPLTLFIVLAVDMIFGQTINRITLFALILALGMLVDDAIVVIENIHRHMQQAGHQLRDKAALIIQATNETGRPTIIATFAVILAFLPMLFVTGMMGPYMAPIPFNTSIAMFASLIIAYMFTPWIAARWLPAHNPGQATTHDSEPVAHAQQTRDWMHRYYSRYARRLLGEQAYRRNFWLVLALLFIVAMWQPIWQFVRPAGINGPATPGTVALKMLPKGNKNTFNITIDMPEGTSMEVTDQVARRIGDVLRLQPMVTDYETYVGNAGPVDFNGMLRGAAAKRGPHLAEIRVNLLASELRTIKSEQIVLQLRSALNQVYQDFPLATVRLVEDPPGPPVRSTVLAEIYGPDYEHVRALARQVRKEFARTWDLTDIDDSISADQQEYLLVVDKEKAAAVGVNTAQIGRMLRDLVAGFDIGQIHDSHERHPVMIHIQIPRHLRIAPRDMDRLYVTNQQGRLIPLSSIARVTEITADKPVYTKDGFPVAYVSAEPRTSPQVYPLLDLDQRLDHSTLIAGTEVTTGGMRFTHTTPDPGTRYQILWDGEMRLTLDVFRDLGAAFIVGIVLIYVLLVGYYGNFMLPLIVMGAIPLTMIGIFPGHMITGQPFTATSMIGMIALAGIVVRNSLLLIDFILERRAAGVALEHAVIEAGAIRARPILLTALAIIAGTAILISDPVFGGLGVAMAFGTLASTLLTLFVIPLLYYLWQRNQT
ncbi:MAG: efflux RND transporter permease subunit [Gammaproteobacteria bacterium]|nr:efflux RND transporter permease subunit [Gammaproteobacteria bacterium]